MIKDLLCRSETFEIIKNLSNQSNLVDSKWTIIYVCTKLTDI